MIREELIDLIGEDATDLLISRYGEPEIEESDRLGLNPPRRLVFPWKAVKEGER